MKRLLISGANGFTGIHLAKAATTGGFDVVNLDVDLRDASAVAAEVIAAEPDAVVHLAAISAVTHGDAAELYAVNVVGTCNLLDALLRLPKSSLKPQLKVVLASSANVYGNSPDAAYAPIKESSPLSPINHYACSKLAMEYMARTFLDRLHIVLARPFNYSGPGHDARFVLPKLIGAFAERLPGVELGNIEVEREFNDVRFVVAAYLRLLDHGVAGETYNLCTGVGHSLNAVINELVRLTGHKPEISVNPAFVRANEVFRLTGDPTKLTALGAGAGANARDLTGLLRWMLAEYKA